MNHNLYTTLLSLAISGALLIVGAMAVGQAPRLPDSVDTDAQADARAAETTAEARTPEERKQRRRSRASLSMPYFSFAQSLRPRG